ncbi:hypothetical protein [Micromonospora parva]|uniref:hypothetical protein n=1 Tax=Micromonospora parva TaxID=1464048 RepID=UPI0036506F64
MNLWCRLPDGEDVSIPMVWIAEVYTPATFQGLLNGVKRIEARTRGFKSNHDIYSWVTSARSRRGTYAGDLPSFHPPGYGSPVPWIEDSLPDGVEYITWRIFAPSPSITILVAGFALDSSRMREPVAILNSEHSTYVSPYSDSGFSIITPDNQKRRYVEEWRESVIRDATAWLQSRMPGTFSSLNKGLLPSMELILTANVTPWSDEANLDGPRRFGADPYTVLDIRRQPHWLQAGGRGLRLNETRHAFGRQGLRWHLRLGAKRSEYIGAAAAEESERNQLWRPLHRTDEELTPLLARWAMNALLAEFSRDLAALRDLAMETASHDSPGALNKLRDKLLQAGLHGQLVADEIAQSARSDTKEERHSFDEVPEFVYTYGGGREPSIEEELVENLRQARVAMGKDITQTEGRLRELLTTSAEITVAATNLRLQKRVFWLTAISAVVAVAAAIISLIALDVARNPPVETPPAGPNVVRLTDPPNPMPGLNGNVSRSPTSP